MPGDVAVKRALISVSDKTGVVEFAKGLQENFKVEILSTGGTAKSLRAGGVKVKDVSEYTGFPEMMDGRVKTLHPKVHGGLLAIRGNAKHMDEAKKNGVEMIDLVAVNLYPFEATVAKPGVKLEEAVEQIDIGGPSMLRSAAKNFESVAIITNPARYGDVLAEMKAKNGAVGLETRRWLAFEAYLHTAKYDASISNYLYGQFKGVAEKFPPMLPISCTFKEKLRYGENPHQEAALYRSVPSSTEPCMANAIQLQGEKVMGYNNVLDGDSALELLREFNEDGPAAVVVKHNNPCGVALGKTLKDAFVKARATDMEAAFGGVVALNEKVTEEVAKEIITQLTDVLIAPDYAPGAMPILAQRRNMRVMKIGDIKKAQRMPKLEFRSVVGGVIVQDKSDRLVNEMRVVTKRQPSKSELDALLFAMKVCKHTKSNAVIYAKPFYTVAIGAGQMKRADSSRLGAMKAVESLKGASVASDAFFPFRDAIDVIAQTGATAIAQPGGSIRDKEVVDACNEHGIAMVFTGVRHFKH